MRYSYKRTCLSGTKVHELTPEERRGLKAHPAEDAQVAALKVIHFTWLYWYKSTDTDAAVQKGLWPSAEDAKVVEARKELWPEGGVAVAGIVGEAKVVLGKGPVTLSERNGTHAAAEGAAGAGATLC